MTPTIVTARAVSTPRFFETERGYQGELLAELRAALLMLGLPGDAIVEQEYQKTFPKHRITVDLSARMLRDRLRTNPCNEVGLRRAVVLLDYFIE
jgi:hypothetical protein